MKVTISEKQLNRVKDKLTIEEQNYLDQILKGGQDLINKGIDKAKELIPGTDVVKKSTDDPKKADLVGNDVDKFLTTLNNINATINQQARGTMRFQQDVESVQIALSLLGYSLPKYGVDGLFGPETAAAINKYKKDKQLVETFEQTKKEFLEELQMVRLGDTSYSNVDNDNDSTKNDKVNQALLDDIQKAAESVGVNVVITTAKTGHNDFTTSGKKSRHGSGVAVDVSILNGERCKASGPKNNCTKFNEAGNALKDALVALGYRWNSESGNDKAVLWQTSIGGNHYNHLHISNKAGASDGELETVVGGATITAKLADSLHDQVKAKNITSADLDKFIDPAIKSGGGAEFTDLDLNTTEGYEAYAKICDNYIDSRNPNSPINGRMMADSARNVFERYRKYVPPELALAQAALEGGIDAKPGSRPTRTRNPFNVGNTETKDRSFNSYQEGVDAYYTLMARNYLVGGKTAATLANDFRNGAGNRYASAENYESALVELINSIRKRNEPVYASLNLDEGVLNEDLLTEADKRQAIKNAFGFGDDWANEFHNMSDKLSAWIADSTVKKLLQSGEARDGQRSTLIDAMNTSGPQGYRPWQELKTGFEYILHWLRSPRRDQINVRDLTYDEAYGNAQEWHDNLETRTQENFQENGDVFIDYRNSNGVGYYWVHLHKNYCPEEADRMGHCGRSSGSGQGQLISFRRINEFGEGASLLTVDYRPGGVLGDFHRHGNKKPTARFHRQIMDFLVNQTYPVTALVRDGVHRYEDNFQLRDLSIEQRREVYSQNPALKYNIDDPASIEFIVNDLISGDLSLNAYRGDALIKLIRKSKSMGKQNEFKALFDHDTIINFYNQPPSSESDKEAFISEFSDVINRYLKDLIDEGDNNDGVETFKNSLRYISQNFFRGYEALCPYIDYGFKKFNNDHAEILGVRGIKRTILSCTDSIDLLHRFSENKPTDRNGNLMVKTEDGFWGLIKGNGDTILHPRFKAIEIAPMDRTGKSYIVKNVNNEFFTYNIESGETKKLPSKNR
jgi:lysozyme family protein